MQPPNQIEATFARELERVERTFAELGLLPDAPARARAGEPGAAANREHEAEASLASNDPSPDAPRTAMLQLARRLFAGTAPALVRDAKLLARLIDRLADELGDTRAHVARELLLVGPQPPGGMAPSAEVLLALVEAGDRRLTRLGFDLHDGPLQELMLLGEDLRTFRAQLATVLGSSERARLLNGRLDDLDARLLELERGLRRVSTAVHASFLLDGPFADALRELTEAFAARSGISPAVRLDGEPASISPSQRIALLSVVGEALNNVREHARTASKVEIAIALGAEGVVAHVRDDGCGFDVEAALLDAARRGRIGLAGIYERVRLLGGECVLDSRPGGPTHVSLRLPRWETMAGSAAAAGGD